MVRLFEHFRRAQGTHKAVYVAPMKVRLDGGEQSSTPLEKTS